jgi:hypothetical protein
MESNSTTECQLSCFRRENVNQPIRTLCETVIHSVSDPWFARGALKMVTLSHKIENWKFGEESEKVTEGNSRVQHIILGTQSKGSEKLY